MGYTQVRQRLETRIRELGEMRDAQAEDSETFEHFQDRAQDVAQALILLENNESTLCSLDNQVLECWQQAGAAEQDRRDGVRLWTRLVVVASSSGALLLAVGVASGMWPLLLAGLAASASAVAAGWRRAVVAAQLRDREQQASAALVRARRERSEFAGKVLPEET